MQESQAAFLKDGKCIKGEDSKKGNKSYETEKDHALSCGALSPIHWASSWWILEWPSDMWVSCNTQ